MASFATETVLRSAAIAAPSVAERVSLDLTIHCSSLPEHSWCNVRGVLVPPRAWRRRGGSVSARRNQLAHWCGTAEDLAPSARRPLTPARAVRRPHAATTQSVGTSAQSCRRLGQPLGIVDISLWTGLWRDSCSPSSSALASNCVAALRLEAAHHQPGDRQHPDCRACMDPRRDGSAPAAAMRLPCSTLTLSGGRISRASTLATATRRYRR
jgi:hypothetical protein